MTEDDKKSLLWTAGIVAGFAALVLMAFWAGLIPTT